MDEETAKVQLEIVKADRSLAAAERHQRSAVVANSAAVAELARVERAKDRLITAGPQLCVAVRIQHHPSRRDLLPGLLRKLRTFDDVGVITDATTEGRDTWATHRACLEALPDDATHLLVIQDDALPCKWFARQALDAIAQKPDVLLAFFAPGFGFIKRRMLEAQKRGDRFALLPGTAFVPVVSLCYPRAIVERLLAWADGGSWPNASPRALRGSDDGIVATFTRVSRFSVWATVPCLCDHRDDVPSLARPSHRPGAHRRAALL